MSNEEIVNNTAKSRPVNMKDLYTCMDLAREDEAVRFAEWCTPRYRYNPTVKEWQDTRTLKIYTTQQLYQLFKKDTNGK